jgi:hypothetical protein
MVIKALGLDFFGTLLEAEADRDTCVSRALESADSETSE